MKDRKRQLLSRPIQHIDIKHLDLRGLIQSMQDMAFTSRDLHRATEHFERMLADRSCSIFLGLAGSLVSAGLKQVIIDMLEANMVDAVVSTGANIVDQDFFEALGFRHYVGDKRVDDNELRRMAIDRIYDTYIDEDQLKVCDRTIAELADSLEPGPYSSREFIREMGRWLEGAQRGANSIVHTCYRKGVPVFCPAFSDSSAGFGLVFHQWHAAGEVVRIDSVRDFLELTKIKISAENTGIFLVGGGVPKNFIQDTVVAAEVLGFDSPMHKYAVQITVADERDGGLSGSTLQEACSWGKVDTTYEQMVYAEATVAFPLIVAAAFQNGTWRQREEKRYSDALDSWHATRSGEPRSAAADVGRL
ncbi:MAG: 1,9-bis(guanidino)-5-aza-nonane synthase [Planctomycetota bacterium]|jgi:deoxyhypusine synthase